MELATLILASAALVLGAIVGWLAARSRTAGRLATAAAERDSAQDRLQQAQADHRDASARLDDTTRQLRAALAEQATLETTLAHTREAADEKLALLRDEQARLGQEFERLSAAALRQNRDEFLQLAGERLRGAQEKADAELQQRQAAVQRLVEPLSEQLAKVSAQSQELETARTDAYARIQTQLTTMGEASEKLRTETRDLTTALRASHVRGRWGEFQLRRVVEAAGMVEHVDFTEQAQAETDDGRLRPDLVVHLAGGKHLVVDAKVAFSGYLEAQEAREEHIRRQRLDAHARHLRQHIDQLAGKKYWEQFSPTPEFVVMFVPADVFLTAALERDPSLMEHGFAKNVILATPATLVALMRTVAYSWRQEALAENAERVLHLGRELHARLATMGGHLNKLGRQLDNAVGAYNQTVSSIESRVLVSARRMTELKVVDDELDGIPQVDTAARHIQAPELVANADDALVSIDHLDRRYGIEGDVPPARGAEGQPG